MKASRLALVLISSMVLAAGQETIPVGEREGRHDAVLDTKPWFGIWSGTRPTYAEVDATAGACRILDRDPLALDER